MFIRKLVTSRLAVGPLFAEDMRQEEFGGFLWLKVTGELVQHYSKLAGWDKRHALPNSYFETSAIVAQHLVSGQLRIEHSMPIVKRGAPAGLITLTAIVDRHALKMRETLARTATYSSPAAEKLGEKPVFTLLPSKEHVVELTDMKGVKLRSWTLETEVGE